MRVDLAELSWTLSGYIPTSWSMGRTMELVLEIKPEVGPVPARVPASVQQLLLEAGELPDWNVGLNSRLCEWAETRDWMYSTELPPELRPADRRTRLHCAGLDGPGVVLLDGRELGTFDNGFVPFSFELPPGEGKASRLELVFTPAPRHLGTPNYSSRIRDWKARFNYVWDWMPRCVQLGVWDRVTLELEEPATLGELKVLVSAVGATGVLELAAPELSGGDRVRLRLDGRSCAGYAAEVFRRGVRLECPGVELWNCVGRGPARRYELTVELLDEQGKTVAEERRRIGFREVLFEPNPGAPAGAEPWLCRLNGEPLFLFGIDWTPIRPNYADLTERDYRTRLELYRDLGFNLLRVWGGGFPEHEIFFELCDELGFLVWLEFPLSSSGPDNVPPEDPEYVAQLAAVGCSYLRRRRHRPSILLYCGGNELQTRPDGQPGAGRPLDATHPALAALARVVREEDPQRRFVATSAGGPVFVADPRHFGEGVHHDVHGPWTLPGGTVEAARDYWAHDDALFRSEVGAPSAQREELIRKYLDQFNPDRLSGDNPGYRRFRGWLEDEAFRREFGREPESLTEYVAWSRERQAVALELAYRSARRRFPALGGLILWMGHDSFPCPFNTSIVEFDGTPKPAALRLGELHRNSSEEFVNEGKW